MIKIVWKCINIIAISPKRGMEQAEIIDTFWTYHQSAVILYHAVSLLLDIGKNTSVRQHVGHRPSWSSCHARRTPRESHPGRRTAVTMTNEPSNHRPTSHFEVARTKEPS